MTLCTGIPQALDLQRTTFSAAGKWSNSVTDAEWLAPAGKTSLTANDERMASMACIQNQRERKISP